MKEQKMGTDCLILNEKEEKIESLGRASIFEDILDTDFESLINREETIKTLDNYKFWIEEATNFLKTINDENIIFVRDNIYYDSKDSNKKIVEERKGSYLKWLSKNKE